MRKRRTTTSRQDREKKRKNRGKTLTIAYLAKFAKNLQNVPDFKPVRKSRDIESKGVSRISRSDGRRARGSELGGRSG